MIYSVSPESYSQRRQCVGEGRYRLGVPRRARNLASGSAVLQIPEPYQRIEPKTYPRRTFGALTFEALRLLGAEQLLCAFESLFDRPSAAETADYSLSFELQIGADKEVVLASATWIASNDHQQWFFADVVPDDLSGVDEHGAFVLAFGDSHLLPLFYGLRKEIRFFQGFAPNAWASPSELCLRFGQIEDDGVFSHVGYDLCTFGSFAYQCRVKAVAMANKAPFGQPGLDLPQHSAGQFGMAWAFFDAQAHIDWQTDGFAFPRRDYSQGDHNQVQTMREDGEHIRKYRVSPPERSLDVFSSPSKERVVQIEVDPAFRAERFDQQQCNDLPETRQLPAGPVEKAVKGVVGSSVKLACKWDNAGDGAPGSTHYPTIDQRSEDLSGWGGKDWKKVFENSAPCRCNGSVHTDLPVLMNFLPKTSERQYVCAQFPSNHSQKLRKSRKYEIRNKFKS